MLQSRLTILLSGMLAADAHQGGATWAVLQYVLGLRRLGHEVYLVEPVAEDRLLPATIRYFRQVVADFGLQKHASLLVQGKRETVGVPYAELAAAARRADLLLNISGMLTDPELMLPPRVRAYLDLDPAFIQLWQAVQGIDMRFQGHTHFVTIGQAIGRPECPVPACGVSWIPTPQPIVLEHWPVAERIAEDDAWTTIGNWRGYGSVEHDGVFYGQKAHSLRPLMELPRRTAEKFRLALAIHPEETKDLESLAANGWELIDPTQAAGTPANYQRFIQGSKGEFGIAKSGYVASRCGWFSDRSICYLASGRPVLAQDTGFTQFVPAGEGLFAFATADDVLGAMDRIRTDYARHARAARLIAETHFDSDVVLPRLLARLGLPSGA